MQEYSELVRYVTEAKGGDEEAFVHIYRMTCQLVYNMACASVKDPEEAKDIVSEVYIRVFRNLGQLRSEQSFIKWLTVITQHVCTDHQQEGTPDDDELAMLSIAGSEDIIEEWHRRENIHGTIQKLIGQLPETQQRAVQYVYFRQLSIGQAAALENCSIGTMKSRLFYARETLRKAIAEEERRSGDKLHVPVAAAMLSALMMLPEMPFSLSSGEAAQILSAVLGALNAQIVLEKDAPGVIPIREEDEDGRRAHPFAALRRKYLLRFTPVAAIAAMAVVITASVCIGVISVRSASGDSPEEGPMSVAAIAAADGTAQETAETTAYPEAGREVRFTTAHGAEIIGIVSEDASVCVTEIVCPAATLDIPARIDGLPVTEIADGAFDGNPAVEDLCLSDRLERVSGRAIAALTNLEGIHVPESSLTYCSVNGILYTEDMTVLTAYPNGKPDTSFRVPDTVKIIGAYAMNSRTLTSLTFGTGTSVERMEEYCIAGCTALTELCLPTTLTDVQPHALESPTVTYFRAAAGKENIFSWGGALLSYDKTKYIRYPAADARTSYTLPSPVISICGYAFYGAENLRKIVIPASVTEIDVNAFAGCVNLEQLYFEGICPAITGGEWFHLDANAVRFTYKQMDDSWDAWDDYLK